MWCDDGRRNGGGCPDREFGEWICAECPHSCDAQAKRAHLKFLLDQG